MNGVRIELEKAGIIVLGCEADKGKEFDEGKMLDGIEEGVDVVVKFGFYELSI